MRRRGLIALAGAATLVLAPADGPAAGSANPQLRATVGPGYSISLKRPDGTDVTKVDPGTYDVEVRDLSSDHNFHLSGPGVDESTSVSGLATVTWTVTFRDGRYSFFCDPHDTEMRGEFVAGTPPPPPPPRPLPPPAKKLLLTVGPGATITLRSGTGAVLKGLKAGSYSIVVRDRSRVHNAHLVGKGVNRKSGLAATGTLTWSVKLAAGALRFYSDRSPRTVKGSITVSR